MASITHYDVLEISRGASTEEIKTAYRALAHASHPDKHPGNTDAEKRFRDITEAYDILGDHSRRLAYDLTLKPPKTIGELLLQHPDGKKTLEHFFETAPAAPHIGEDVGMVVRISRELLKKGGFVEITLNRRGNDGEQTLSIQIPPDTDKTPWCRIPNLGKPGKNWGSTGDLYIIFQP